MDWKLYLKWELRLYKYIVDNSSRLSWIRIHNITAAEENSVHYSIIQ